MSYSRLALLILKAIVLAFVVLILVLLSGSFIVAPLSEISIPLGLFSMVALAMALVFGVVFFSFWAVNKGWF